MVKELPPARRAGMGVDEGGRIEGSTGDPPVVCGDPPQTPGRPRRAIQHQTSKAIRAQAEDRCAARGRTAPQAGRLCSPLLAAVQIFIVPLRKWVPAVLPRHLMFILVYTEHCSVWFYQLIDYYGQEEDDARKRMTEKGFLRWLTLQCEVQRMRSC